MPQLSKISKNNTTTTLDGHGRIDSVTLHHTRILEIDWGKGEITVNTGGYNTVTTQTRLNQAFNQLGLPFYASRKGRDLYIMRRDGRDPTGNGMVCDFTNKYTVRTIF